MALAGHHPKRTKKKRVVEVTRKMMQGTLKQANKLLQASCGGTVLNTALIEHFNGTMREHSLLSRANVVMPLSALRR